MLTSKKSLHESNAATIPSSHGRERSACKRSLAPHWRSTCAAAGSQSTFIASARFLCEAVGLHRRFTPKVCTPPSLAESSLKLLTSTIQEHQDSQRFLACFHEL